MKDSSQRTIIELRQALSQRVIPWVSAEQAPRMILAQRPLRLPPEIPVKRHLAPALQIDGKCKSNLFLAQYKNEAMHAIRFPYLCCVLEGEIDVRLGLPSRQGKFPHPITTYQTITLPALIFLLIPPGTLYPDGSQPYWQRSPLPPTDTRLFWMRILPTGAFCHSSTVRNGKYTADHHDIFVPGLQLPLLTEMLMDELQSSDADAILAAQSTLLLLLLRIRRSLGDGAQAIVGHVWKDTGKSSPLKEHDSSTTHPAINSTIVERACAYIRAHTDKPLSIEDIAGYAHVSPAYLTRLFRIEMKTTVMKYVLGQRLQVAQSMLANTEISIQEIARFVGYRQAPQFNRVFKKIHHISPTEFRHRHRRSENLSQIAKE